jgi:hypothetical protein
MKSLAFIGIPVFRIMNSRNQFKESFMKHKIKELFPPISQDQPGKDLTFSGGYVRLSMSNELSLLFQ